MKPSPISFPTLSPTPWQHISWAIIRWDRKSLCYICPQFGDLGLWGCPAVRSPLWGFWSPIVFTCQPRALDLEFAQYLGTDKIAWVLPWVQNQIRKVKVKCLKAKKQCQASPACQRMPGTSRWSFCLTYKWKGTESGQPRSLWDSASHPRWVIVSPWATLSGPSWGPLRQSPPRAKAQSSDPLPQLSQEGKFPDLPSLHLLQMLL